MAKRSPIQDGRTIVSDRDIEDLIWGTMGPYYIWTNPTTQTRSAFGYIYGIGEEKGKAMGEILFYRDRDIDLITSDIANMVFTVSITQPDSIASAARRVGLRPQGRIIGVQRIEHSSSGD